jgi:hypothetical protein
MEEIDGLKAPMPSPRISHLSWGRVTVSSIGSFKDVKLFPGGAREWDWRETGTNHSPGVQPTDVEELLDHGVAVVILGTGMLGRLGVCPETLDMLEAQGVEARVSRTEYAVREYNELREGEPVGALIHSTC